MGVGGTAGWFDIAGSRQVCCGVNGGRMLLFRQVRALSALTI